MIPIAAPFTCFRVAPSLVGISTEPGRRPARRATAPAAILREGTP